MNKLTSVRLIVVTQDFSLRRYLGELLLDSFSSVHFTDQIDEALKLIEKNNYDVVISDYFLGTANGIEFRQAMVKITTTPYFIMLTANAGEKPIVEQLKKDSFTILQKPPHPSELVLLIRSWFKKSKAA